jgi:hypothetical protein
MDEPLRPETEDLPKARDTTDRRPYEKPRVTCVGDVETLTRGGHSGAFDGHGGKRSL